MKRMTHRDYFSYPPSHWLHEDELLLRSGLTRSQVVDRCIALREDLLLEFNALAICNWGLDNPFAQEHALATLRGFARENMQNRRLGARCKPDRSLAVHIGLMRRGPHKLPAAVPVERRAA